MYAPPWNPLKEGTKVYPACRCCFLSQLSICKDFIGLSTQYKTVGTGTKTEETEETVRAIQLTALEWHSNVSSLSIQRMPPPPPANTPGLCPHLRAEDGPGNSMALQFVVGRAPCYWWVSRSVGLCGFQQAPQRLPDGPSQDGAYCGTVSMGVLQMEPPGVIRLLRRGVKEGAGGGGGIRATEDGGGGGQSYLWGRSVTPDSHGMNFFLPFCLDSLRFCKERKRLCFTRLRPGEWNHNSTESYLSELQGRSHISRSVAPLWVFGS